MIPLYKYDSFWIFISTFEEFKSTIAEKVFHESYYLDFKLQVSPKNNFYFTNSSWNFLLWKNNCGSALIKIMIIKACLILRVLHLFFPTPHFFLFVKRTKWLALRVSVVKCLSRNITNIPLLYIIYFAYNNSRIDLFNAFFQWFF